MEKGSGFRYHHHHPYLMSPNPSLFGFPIDTGHLNTKPIHKNPHSVEESTFRNAPPFPFFGLQHPNASEPNNSRNWLYNMPCFPNAFPPLFNSASKEMFHVFDFGRHKSPTTGPTPPQKKFIVFDQSGDKTTLMYSSGVHTPVQCGPSRVPSPPTTCNLTKDELRVSTNPLRPSMNDENVDDNSRDVTGDEMREDTDELDALLCSDSDFSEDDEETSTGHSPSTMTDNGVRDLVEEIGEEVDSFAGPTKRRKILSGGYNVGPAASSLKTFGCSALEEDDALSVCGDVNKQCKRSRRDKIHETLRTLQSVIPNAKGKDAIVVIDEAIHYLRSLKVKAKALGLDAL